MSALEEILARVRSLGPDGQAAIAADAIAASKDRVWVPNPGPQTQAYFSPADELFYGGQAGGGKTDLGIGLAFTCHKRSLVLRRLGGDALKLVERASEILGHRDGLNAQLKRWRWSGKLVEFAGCEMESDKQRFKGDPHDLIVFDEGSDFLESQYVFIIGWNRSAEEGQRCRVVVTSNPPTTAAGLWVIKRWGAWVDNNHPRPAKPGELRWYTTVDGEDTEVDGRGPHLINGEKVFARSRTYIPARLSDNPDLARTDYDSVLAGMTEELRRAYRDGDWSVGQRDDDFQVIPTGWIEAAQQRWRPTPPEDVPMTVMSIDVAPGGGDQRVIGYRYDAWVAPLEAKREVDKTGRLTAAEVVKHRRDGAPVVVDVGGGWGGDCLIALKDNRIDCVAFNGVVASTARTRDGKLKFRNKRAEAVWRTREALDPSQKGGSDVALPPDPELKADLAAYRYENTINGLLIEDKEEMKKRIGRSPDKGDTVCMLIAEGQKAADRADRSGYGRSLPTHANVGHAAAKRKYA